ncbi:MAG: hypothetical protein H0T41_03460 [Rhodobacteraceae bacterium]|nr:hypothetical protein [Paracoccaceae bacterium]
MIPAAARRSTPLRLTGILIGVFTLSLLVCFAVAYAVVRSNFDTILHDQVRQSMASYESIRDDDDLRERLAADATTIDPAAMILQYTPDSGARIANIDHFPPVSDFGVVHEGAISGEDELSDSYLALSRRVRSGLLIVAQTREQVVEMGEILVTVGRRSAIVPRCRTPALSSARECGSGHAMVWHVVRALPAQSKGT